MSKRRKDWRDEFTDWNKCPDCDRHVFLHMRLQDGSIGRVNVLPNGDLFIQTPCDETIAGCGTPANAAKMARLLFNLAGPLEVKS